MIQYAAAPSPGNGESAAGSKRATAGRCKVACSGVLYGRGAARVSFDLLSLAYLPFGTCYGTPGDTLQLTADSSHAWILEKPVLFQAPAGNTSNRRWLTGRSLRPQTGFTYACCRPHFHVRHPLHGQRRSYRLTKNTATSPRNKCTLP